MKASEPLEWTLNPRRHGIGDFEVQLNELGIVYVGGVMTLEHRLETYMS